MPNINLLQYKLYKWGHTLNIIFHPNNNQLGIIIDNSFDLKLLNKLLGNFEHIIYLVNKNH